MTSSSSIYGPAANGQAGESLPGALDGIRVLDFTIVMSGPMCTRSLADAGAEVIKVESPEGDVVRQRPPLIDGYSTYFASMNCGKRSIVLDLRTEDGRRVARELARHCDVVVENFRPGVMSRLGLDHATLSEDNPRLIYCSLSGFGQTGPKADAPAYAPVIHAASGYEMAYTQYQRGQERPANNGIFIADVLGATHATGAILMALYERERSGRGQHIDLSLLDAVLGMLIYEIQAAQFPPDRPRQVYEPVRSNDGYVMVAAVTPKNLEVLFDVIGFPEGKTDPRFATVRAKEQHWAELLAVIEAWTSQRSGEDCERTLMAAGVPCSRYRTVGAALEDPQLVGRGFLSELQVGDQAFKVPNLPFRLSRTPPRAGAALPELGEDTDTVLGDLLELDSVAVADLRDRGVFGRPGRPAGNQEAAPCRS